MGGGSGVNDVNFFGKGNRNGVGLEEEVGLREVLFVFFLR